MSKRKKLQIQDDNSSDESIPLFPIKCRVENAVKVTTSRTTSAAELVKFMTTPSNLRSPSQLYWHKIQFQRTSFPRNRTTHLKMTDCTYRPCIIVNISNKWYDHTSIDSDEEEEEMLIEYISFSTQQLTSNSSSERKNVSMRRLIPFYGNLSTCKRCGLTKAACYCVKYDHGSTWCQNLCNLYREQRRADLLSAMNTSTHPKRSTNLSSSYPYNSKKRHLNRDEPSNEVPQEIEIQVEAELLFLEGLVSTSQLHPNGASSQYTKEPIKNSSKEVKRGRNRLPSSDSDSMNERQASEPQVIKSNLKGTYTHRQQIRALQCSDSDSSQSDESSYEEPYTQALGNIHASTKNTLEDSEDEREKNRRFFNPTSPERKQNHSSSPKSKEPIRPGDVISYYHPMFRWGDVRGKRTATVLSVDPRRTPILVLDNGEVLPQDTKIQRIKIPFSRSTKILGKGGKGRKIKETVLVDHPGLFRFIEDFNLKLRNGDIGVDAGIQAESKRIKNIIQNNSMSIEEQARLLAGDLEESSSSSSSGTSIHSSSSSSSSSSSLLIVSPLRKNESSEKSSERNAYVRKTISSSVSSSTLSSQSISTSKRPDTVLSPRLKKQPFRLKLHPCKRPKTNPIVFDLEQDSSEFSDYDRERILD